jgi:hypothetical protein
MKKSVVFITLSTILLTSCSQTTEKKIAAPAIEAASVEWIDYEINKMKEEGLSLEERIKKLELELQGGNSEVSNPPAKEGEGHIFSDVPNEYWAFNEISNLYQKGIIKGYPEKGVFYPEEYITRYQAASMLVKALGLPVSNSPSIFKDVPSDHYGIKEIMTVYDYGIFKGSDGLFLPNQPMKRRHMAMVLQRAFTLKENGESFSDYYDVSQSLDGYDAIKTISQYGVARGSNGYFMPEDPTKRSHFSAFTYRALSIAK